MVKEIYRHNITKIINEVEENQNEKKNKTLYV